MAAKKKAPKKKAAVKKVTSHLDKKSPADGRTFALNGASSMNRLCLFLIVHQDVLSRSTAVVK
jgi:hypothetical protein